MAATLHETLLTPDVQPRVVADCETMIKDEVSDMSGISGTGIKLAYRVVNTFAAEHVHYMLETLMPRMADQLQPYWADFNAAGGGGFGDYLAGRGDEVAESLLTVTDDRANGSGRPVIVKAYSSVRGGAVKHVRGALPRLGTIVQKYAV
jgi:hypothetical protein